MAGIASVCVSDYLSVLFIVESTSKCISSDSNNNHSQINMNQKRCNSKNESISCETE